MSHRRTILVTLFTVFCALGSVEVRANMGWPISHAEAENCGRITVAPNGGESLVDPFWGNDYRIHLTIQDSDGDPIVGLAATDMYLWHEDLVTCPGVFNQADGPTDADGHTTFSGKIYAGLAGDGISYPPVDCSTAFLYVYALGILLNDEEPVCVSTDSPDLSGDLEVTPVDFAHFAYDFNCYANGQACDPCHDFDENGITDSTDFAIFATYYRTTFCP